jgi:Leucine-rich repeat (LRR) protein/PKD repeat protein
MTNRRRFVGISFIGLALGFTLAGSHAPCAASPKGPRTGWTISRHAVLFPPPRVDCRSEGTRQAIPSGERAALIALYQSTGGDAWTDRTNWRNAAGTDFNDPGTEGTWFGVTLDETAMHVESIDLSENNLAGTLPAEIGNLPFLRALILNGDRLAGPLPSQIGNLGALVWFSAWGNGFTGSLPPSLGQLANLQELDLGGNSLTGGIPAEFSGMSSLQVLFLNDNRLDGPLPPSLGQLSQVRRIILSRNAFTGGIPDAWSGLGALEVLWLNNNDLGGDFPTWIAGFSSLTDLELSLCGLTGNLPTELGGLSNLRNLYLGGNHLTGPIPDSLGNLTLLESLALPANNLSGPVPASIWDLTNLTYLDLSGNPVGGLLLPSIANLTKLRYLLLEKCGLEGPIPTQFGSFPDLLQLSLDRNALFGTLPPELGSLSKLQLLGLSGNMFRGEIPPSFMGLTSLENGWGLGLNFNSLSTPDPSLLAFLLTKGDDFRFTQTLPPTALSAEAASGGTARLSWTPISYLWDPGGYHILMATAPGGPFTQVATTADKTASSWDVGGLQPSTTYYFALKTFTEPHEQNPNLIGSDWTEAVPFTTAACALSCQASVAPAAGPAPLLVQFQSLVTSGGCSGTPALLWEFGDGETSTDPAPSHLYRYSGFNEWTLTARVDGQTCTTSGGIEVGVGVATGDVFLGVRTWDQLFLLDGPGVTQARANLFDADGKPVGEFPFTAGHFALPDLPTGDYSISVALDYQDHITQDALWGTYGCPAPGTLMKHLTVPPRPILLGGGTNRVDVALPPPIVFLHGARECYLKWTSDDPSDPDQLRHWDNAARAQGFLTFTPNIPGWTPGVSWDTRALAVLDQVSLDLAALRSGTAPAGPVPYVFLGYDMGGLVARAITGGPRWDDPRVLRAQGVYLLGSPNSGSDYLLGGADETPMGTGAIMGSFNEVYPDFGMAGVFAIAGDGGWWNSEGSDGPVTLYSAFNIARVACGGSASGYRCTPYVWQSFDSGEGHIFHYSHRQLGEPVSAQDILVEAILPQLFYSRAPRPESPAGSTIWGTGARTVGNAQGSVQGRTGESSPPLDFPFTISPSQGMGVFALVREGSALFQVLDPSGVLMGAQSLPEAGPDADGPGMEFLLGTPQRGEWTLRVTPGAQGTTFEAVMVENSAFDVFGYLGKEAYGPGETVQLHLDAKGDLTGVFFTSAEAVLEDSLGTPFDTVPLYDDGTHGDPVAGDGLFVGTLQAPSVPNSYRTVFNARGYYLNPADTFARKTECQIEVVRTDHIFTGTFSDGAADQDGDGRSDAIAFSATFHAPSPGSYLVQADLYDSNGYWVDYRTAMVTAASAGETGTNLSFDLSEATCDQFAGPFAVFNLALLDGATFDTLDYWPDTIFTQTYPASGFECLQGTVGPRAYAVYPDQGAPGKSLELLISGESFTDGTSILFGAGMVVDGPIACFSPSLLSVPIRILADATPGFRTLTVANPGTLGKTLHQAFEVRVEGAPVVEITTPWDGDSVTGPVVVAASAWGDERVVEVTFRVDGQVVATLSALPFQILWDSASVPNGSHILTAEARSESGKTGTSYEVTVHVTNGGLPGDCDGDSIVSIGEVQKAINMFLGTLAPGCGADCNEDDAISIGEVQKVINAFLGIASSC